MVPLPILHVKLTNGLTITSWKYRLGMRVQSPGFHILQIWPSPLGFYLWECLNEKFYAMGVWNLDDPISHTEVAATDIRNLTTKLVLGAQSGVAVSHNIRRREGNLNICCDSHSVCWHKIYSERILRSDGWKVLQSTEFAIFLSLTDNKEISWYFMLKRIVSNL
jgi:hypothetical protein